LPIPGQSFWRFDVAGTLRLRQQLLLKILDFAHSGGNFSFAYVNGFPLLALTLRKKIDAGTPAF
jgi:hypothetical protein